jgi:AcrR family transcriptional regulator
MDAGENAGLGLRARIKRETSEAISAAALRLALERGPENVRVEDIATEAGVSPRTYNNYFSSREQAICAALAAGQALRIRTALRARPAGEPLDEALGHAMAEQYGGEPDRLAIALVTETPGLRGEYLKTCETTEVVLAQAIADRTGMDPRRDLRARTLAAAVAAAARVATERWQRADAGTPLADVLREALSHLAPALASPETRPGQGPRPRS